MPPSLRPVVRAFRSTLFSKPSVMADSLKSTSVNTLESNGDAHWYTTFDDAKSCSQQTTEAIQAEAPSSAEVPRKEWPWRRAKKCAVMLSFSGKNYMGMQIQRTNGLPTIEEELLRAFRDSGVIAPEWYDNPQKAFFQRASRTDKGVSALKMVVSLKMLEEKDSADKINCHLPLDIRVHALRRVTKNFNAKNSCDARTYHYLMPTFAFSPVEKLLTEDFRMDEETRAKVNTTLAFFLGTKYYHNYTSGKVPHEPSCQRYIHSFQIGEPFVRSGIEFAVITVKGQSFMLHQIRKMLGMTIAVVRGHASEKVIQLTWGEDRIDVPRAPGLGLMLDEVHYEKYNQRFGDDGIHEPLDWTSLASEVDRFKEDLVFADIVRIEKEERNMMTWMSNLPLHNFRPRHFESEEAVRTPLEKALANVGDADIQEETESKSKDD